MKFTLRTFIFVTVTLSIAGAGILQPILERKSAKQILQNCSGVSWPLMVIDENGELVENEWEISALEKVLGGAYLTRIHGAVIAPVPNDDAKLRSFLQKHRGLIGLETLSILSNEKISPTAYHPIHGLDDVRILTIKNATLDRQCFQSLSKMEDLEKLELIDCVFSAADLTLLKQNRHLALLVLDVTEIDRAQLKNAREALKSTFVVFGDFGTVEDIPEPAQTPLP